MTSRSTTSHETTPQFKQTEVVDTIEGTFLGRGGTGTVHLLANGTVLKYFAPGPDEGRRRNEFEIEKAIYGRLGAHPRVVKMLDHSDRKLILEYMHNGTLDKYLSSHKATTLETRLRWAAEAAEAVEVLHSHNILHGDIKPGNLLLDANLNLKIADFGGSNLDNNPTELGEETRYFIPRDEDWTKTWTVKRDLFALGCTIYAVMTGMDPWHDQDSDKVRELFGAGSFPELTGVPCAETIERCWKQQYDSAHEVLDALKNTRHDVKL